MMQYYIIVTFYNYCTTNQDTVTDNYYITFNNTLLLDRSTIITQLNKPDQSVTIDNSYIFSYN